MITTFTNNGYADLESELRDNLLAIGAKYKVVSLQNSGAPEFGTVEFNRLMMERARAISEEIKTSSEPYFIHSDSDVYFFRNPEHWPKFLEESGADILFQQEGNGMACCGLFVCRTIPIMAEFWKEVARVIEADQAKHVDQDIVNAFIQERRVPFRVGYLSTNEATNYGSISKGNMWSGQTFSLPKNLTAFHANFTIGIENKKKLLEYVKNLPQNIYTTLVTGA